ncbi:MAG: hypothetical protein AAF541_03790 [Pseudomonadota bacterium]
MLNKVFTAVAVLLGLAMIANGIFMTVAPEPWYWAIPGVPDRGPFNQHFIRDVGFIYGIAGAAFLYGAINVTQRFQLWLIPTAWLTFHAIFHVWEVIVGICGPEALAQDFAGVTLPALLSIALVYHARTQSHA